jgi:hypothetical protein
MSNTPTRPVVTQAMIELAATDIAKQVNGDASAIAKVYHHRMDGYELAKALERNAFWDIDVALVDDLDNMQSAVDQLLQEAEREWARINNIQPPLPIGSEITRGVITAVSTHYPATYNVKERGCTQDGRFLLVKFEHAISIDQAAGEQAC